MSDTSTGKPGRYEYKGLERVIHEKARLGILTSLASQPNGLLFNDLKRQCSLTDGNLNRHLKVLADEGLVELWKKQSRHRPQTSVQISATGRERLQIYLAVLKQVIADVETATKR